MLGQLNMVGLNKVETAIERLKTFEPLEGYYLAFSGGKDSIVIKELANMAGVKYDAHYNLTTVDPPELVQFIKEYHKDVITEIPRNKDGSRITMWNLIPKKLMPPTRMVRYCCEVLKEGGGEGRFTVTGVRWAESSRRKNTRAGLEINFNKKKDGEFLDPDNPDNAQIARICPTKGKHILNPIIDWEDDDVWEFIHTRDIPYCKLYDQGYTRLGCIGCPLGSKATEELERNPTYKRAYLKAFEKMLVVRTEKGKDTEWKISQDVMDWWLSN
ncbi:MAG: phosphoadenosine phosphosulfate reductase family protein [Aminipila sp.]